MEDASAEKHDKYTELEEKLKRAGWKVIRHTVILGNTGGIPGNLKRAMREFGVMGEGLTILKKQLHVNALKWMNKLIDTEIMANGWDRQRKGGRIRKGGGDGTIPPVPRPSGATPTG